MTSELGQSEYFIAKRAAKKMIEFLKKKQTEKKNQAELDKEARIKLEKNGGEVEHQSSARQRESGRSSAPLMGEKPVGEKKIDALVDIDIKRHSIG